MLELYSPSQISMFSNCHRLWYIAYVLGYKPPTSPARAKGKAIHKQVEQAIRGIPTNDPRARRLLDQLNAAPCLLEQLDADPSPTSFGLEDHIVVPLWDNAALHGYIDLWDRNGDTVWIIDHKTTADLKWSLVEYQLASDIQLLCYAYWAVLSEDATEVIVGHNVVTTKGSIQGKVTLARLTREQILTSWQDVILPKLYAMSLTRRTIASLVPPTGKASNYCDKFGGCYNRERCSLIGMGMIIPPDAPQDRGRESGMALNEEMRKKLLALREKKGSQQPAQAQYQPPQPQYQAQPQSQYQAQPQAQAQAQSQYQPQPQYQTQPQYQAQPPQQLQPPQPQYQAQPEQYQLPAQQPQQPQQPQRLPTIPPGEVMKIERSAPAIDYLLIDAFFEGQEVVSFETAFASELARLDWLAKPYNEGKALVLAAVKAKQDWPPIVLISSHSLLASFVLESLIPISGMVIRGLR